MLRLPDCGRDGISRFQPGGLIVLLPVNLCEYRSKAAMVTKFTYGTAHIVDHIPASSGPRQMDRGKSLTLASGSRKASPDIGESGISNVSETTVRGF